MKKKIRVLWREKYHTLVWHCACVHHSKHHFGKRHSSFSHAQDRTLLKEVNEAWKQLWTRVLNLRFPPCNIQKQRSLMEQSQLNLLRSKSCDSQCSLLPGKCSLNCSPNMFPEKCTEDLECPWLGKIQLSACKFNSLWLRGEPQPFISQSGRLNCF